MDKSEIYHYMLWNWLSLHPTQTKHSWPGWDELREIPENWCFLCELCNTCKDCLLLLKTGMPCSTPHSPYYQWVNSTDLTERTRLARVIRDVIGR